MTLAPFKSLFVTSLLLATGLALGIVISKHPRASAAGEIREGHISVSRPNAKPVPISEAQHPAHQQITEEYLGVTFARQSVEIVARSDGRLEALYANLGDHVKSGDLLARIESASAAQQLEIANASLRSVAAEQRNAEFEVKDSEARYRRRQAMFEAGLLSEEDFATAKVQVDKAEANLDATHAHLAEQTARISQAKQALLQTTIRAPFQGIVAARYVDVGATVHLGMAVINLVRSKDLGVRFAISKDEQAAISIGSKIEFFDEGLNRAVPGVVEHKSPGIDAISQEQLVEAKLAVPAELLSHIKPGLRGYVSVRSKRPRDGSQALGIESASEER